jgi:hypothetical protein
MPNENKSEVSSSFKIEYLYEGGTVVLLSIPDNLLVLIGQVAAQWGAFEVQLDKLMAAIFVSIGTSPEGWERQGFAKRKKLFVHTVRDHLGKTYPLAADNYRKIAGDSADLYWRRNVVVHGNYRINFTPPGSERPIFWAEGVHNGLNVKVDLNEPTLEKLWHGIAHLTGGLIATANLHGSVTASGWPQTFSDTEMLRIYRETSHPWNPIRDKHPHPPESSEK